MEPLMPHPGNKDRTADHGRLFVAPNAPLPVLKTCRWCRGDLTIDGRKFIVCPTCDTPEKGNT